MIIFLCYNLYMDAACDAAKLEITMNQQIAELAKQMNVSYGDVLSLALGVIQGMENDKVAEVFLANEEERVLMAQVYGTAHVAKSNRIMVDYLTKPEYARELQNFVRVSLEVEAA